VSVCYRASAIRELAHGTAPPNWDVRWITTTFSYGGVAFRSVKNFSASMCLNM
jgi:hypothetical protein